MSLSSLCCLSCLYSAGELHGKFDGGAGRAERQLRGGKEGPAEGDGHTDRAREQGPHAAWQKGTGVPSQFSRQASSVHVKGRCWIIFVFYFFSFHVGPKARYSNVWLLNRSGYSSVWSRHENRKSAHTTADGRLGTNIRLCCSCLRPCVSRRPALLTLQTPRSLHCTTRHGLAWHGITRVLPGLGSGRRSTRSTSGAGAGGSGW